MKKGSKIKKISELPLSEKAVLNEPVEGKDSGAEEAELFQSGLSEKEIKENAALKDANRKEKFKDHFEFIVVTALWIAAFVFFCAGIIWAWHLLAPTKCYWLSSEQIAKLQNFVTGGLFTSIFAGHLKRRTE